MNDFFKKSITLWGKLFRSVADVAVPVDGESPEGQEGSAFNIEQHRQRAAEQCPYCSARDFVKRGLRKNKHQEVQLYLCKNPDCGKTFTAQDVKGKHFPLNIVIEGMSYYNLGCTF